MAFQLISVPKVIRTASQRQQDRAERKAQRHADPAGIAAEKRKAKAAEERYRLKIKRKVWNRSSVCEFCADTEAQTAAKSPVAQHEMHETTPRSATRNLPKEERFNLAICARVCRPCHDLIHGKQLFLSVHNEARGIQGDYDVLGPDGQVVRSMRRGIDARPRSIQEARR